MNRVILKAICRRNVLLRHRIVTELVKNTLDTLDKRFAAGFVEKKSLSRNFLTTSQSYLIALEKVTAIKRDTICIGKRELPIGETYKENVGRIFRV